MALILRFYEKITKKVLRLVSILALNYSLNSPISGRKMRKHKNGIRKYRKYKKVTHIPLLEAEFAGLA
jgi:hypothetical protein